MKKWKITYFLFGVKEEVTIDAATKQDARNWLLAEEPDATNINVKKV